MDTSSVVIITCVILAIIFLVQFMGTGRLAHFFAPVIIVWFLLNIAFGIYVSLPLPSNRRGAPVLNIVPASNRISSVMTLRF